MSTLQRPGRTPVFTPTSYRLWAGLDVPDPITFVVSPVWLDRGQLYPRQATLLKVIFLREDLFCADEQTEILTRRGWLTYDQVQVGEDVMTLNTTTGESEWAPAERVNVFPVHDEPLVSMEGRGHSSLTTANHRWPSERLMQRAGGSIRESRFVETRDLSVRDRIACAARVSDLPTDRTWDDAFVELMAWYWTEGTDIVGQRTGVKIGQSKRVNPDHVDRIRACLTTLFGPASSSMRPAVGAMWREDLAPGDMVYFRLNASASEDLKACAPTREKVVTPEFLGSLTQEQLDLFIEASMAADGHSREQPSGKVHRTITQKSRARLDAFQMACSLAGIRTVMSEREVRGSGRYAGVPYWNLSLQEERRYFTPQTRGGRTFTVTEQRHTGHVWCPTTRNGTWLARRRGCVYFTGNTDYDYRVVREWEDSFRLSGKNGITPDILDRMRYLRDNGYSHFREVLLVMGRRAGKGYVSALAMAYVLWRYLAKGDPQGYYGVDRDKQLACFIYAGKKEQARENLWKDLVNVILGGPCFAPYVSRPMGESLSVYAPNDFVRMRRRELRGIETAADQATFTIQPKEATLMSGRGPASFMQGYDEMAHQVSAGGAARSAEEIYSAATPALDQFKKDAFIVEPSSPWQMIGQFYTNWEHALEVDPITGEPTYPEMMMVQLASWEIYYDWQVAHELELFPADFAGDLKEYEDAPHPRLQRLKGAIQEYDEAMRRLEKANPETFSVERMSHWQATVDAYLDPKKIDGMFAPWRGEVLQMQDQGILSIFYKGHADPSLANANFGIAIAHPEVDDATGLTHCVFDYISHWQPSDFPDNTIDYVQIEQEIWNLLTRFKPDEFTFDQWNSAAVIAQLKKRVYEARFPKRVQIWEQTATVKHNWERAENFKISLNQGWVHAPFYELAALELRFLQLKNGKVEKQDTGPVTTKDVADCLFECVWAILGDQVNSFIGGKLASFPVGGQVPGGLDPYARERDRPEVMNQLGQLHRRDFVTRSGHRNPARSATRGGRRR